MSTSSGVLQLCQRAFHLGLVLYYAAVNVCIVLGMEHAYEKLGRPKGDPQVKRMLEGTSTYFTIWTLLMHEIYFSLCCAEYLFEFFPKALPLVIQEQLRSLRRMMLPVLLFPSSCVVVFNFWTLYSVSPRLVFGDFLDVINPMWINHAIHTNIVPIAALEIILRARTEGVWDGGHLRDAFKTTILFTAYLASVLLGRHRRGIWPYPFLDSASLKEFWGTVSFCYITGWTWHYVGRRMARLFSVGKGPVRPSPVASRMKIK